MADKKVVFPVEATHIKMFARSIGDYSPEHVDDEAAKATDAGGIVAPLTFPQAVAQFDPDYPLRPRPDAPWFGSGAHASGVEGKPATSGGLHAEQHFEYMRPLRPGDVLSVSVRDGESWEKESKRAGKLIFFERITEYRDAGGEIVARARSVAVRTERPVDQD